mgnify:CR=1 FL=1
MLTTAKQAASLWPAGRLCGVTITVDRSFWLIPIGLFVVAFSSMYVYVGGAFFEAFVLGLSATTTLLLINFAHEGGHALAGARVGLPPREVRLHSWGASTIHTYQTLTPKALAVMSLAGPIGNLLVAAVAGAFLVAFGHHVFGFVAVIYCVINVGYAVLNLIPLYPRDGGRAIHALFWGLTKDEQRGQRLARWAGVAFGIAAVLFSLVYLNVGWTLIVVIVVAESFVHDYMTRQPREEWHVAPSVSIEKSATGASA